jgi:acyl-CoA synthetase (AMP-forming)/AMP-acid ligase II
VPCGHHRSPPSIVEIVEATAVGALVGHRRLWLLGRRDDLVNIGAIKVPALLLEATIRARPAIADCALQAVHWTKAPSRSAWR